MLLLHGNLRNLERRVLRGDGDALSTLSKRTLCAGRVLSGDGGPMSGWNIVLDHPGTGLLDDGLCAQLGLFGGLGDLGAGLVHPRSRPYGGALGPGRDVLGEGGRLLTELVSVDLLREGLASHDGLPALNDEVAWLHRPTCGPMAPAIRTGVLPGVNRRVHRRASHRCSQDACNDCGHGSDTAHQPRRHPP